MDPVGNADVLIAGFGHPLMGDDALGPHVVEKLTQAGLASGVRVLVAGSSPLDVLAELSGVKKLIVVDALKGVEPGRIIKKRFLTPSDIPPRSESGSHGIGLFETLWLARQLVPDLDIVIIGVGSTPAVTPGSPLSDSLRVCIPTLIALIHQEVCLSTEVS